MMLNRLGFLLCVLSASSVAQTKLPADDLIALLELSKNYSATFTQDVRSEDGEVLDASSGEVFFTRPNTLRWNINEPYEQVLLIKAQKYYQYDQDIDQLLIEPLNEQLMNTPAMLLSGDATQLKANYTISLKPSLEDSEGRERVSYQLIPKQDNGLFKSLQFIFVEQQLVEMKLLDDLLQTNRFQFSHIDTQSPIDASIYHLDPPPYTDIIER